MNVRTDRDTDRHKIYRYHIYVGLAQARPNKFQQNKINTLQQNIQYKISYLLYETQN